MSMTGLQAFDSTLQKTHEWLNAVQQELNLDTKQKAYLVLRAGLHALRDRLTIDDVAHLGAQLPMLVRGFYYEGWKPSTSPLKLRTKDEFVALMLEYMQVTPSAADVHPEPEEALRAVLRVIGQQVTEGEMESLRHTMPEELLELWPDPTAGRKSD